MSKRILLVDDETDLVEVIKIGKDSVTLKKGSEEINLELFE